MFGRRKRRIEREGEDLKKRLDSLESEADKLHQELTHLDRRRNDPYFENPIGTPLETFEAEARFENPRLKRISQRPTRRQRRKQRNMAVAMIVLALFILIWIAAKYWKNLG